MLSMIFIFLDATKETAMQIAGGLYLVTSLVYGCVIGTMPIICSTVFGPSVNSHVAMLYQE